MRLVKEPRFRRLLSRACLGAGAIALVAAVLPTDVGAQTVGSRPRIFSTATDAVGVDYFPDQQGGLTPIKDTFHMQFVSGKSTMHATNGPTARAGVADPGNGATQGPAAACPIFGDSMPPEMQPIFDACTNAKWPLSTQADGFTPDKRTEGALVFGEPNGQMYGGGGGAHAVIFEDGTSATDAAMSGLRIAPLPGGGDTGLPLPAIPGLPGQTPGAPVDTSLFSAGSIESTTANFFEGATAVSHSESRLSDVRLIGGLATIDSITSIAESRYELGADPVGASSTIVQGVKFLGQGATIDDQGIHPEGNPADNSLNEALGAAGLSVRLVGATQGLDNAGFMTAQSQGVVIDFTRELNLGLPSIEPPPNPLLPTAPSVDGTYFVRSYLASVSTRAFARNLTASSAPARPSGGSGSGGITSVPTSPTAGANRPSGFTGGTAVVPAPAGGGSDGGTSATGVPVLFGLNVDLRWLYLAFTLAAFGMCLAPRLVLPARLPGT